MYRKHGTRRLHALLAAAVLASIVVRAAAAAQAGGEAAPETADVKKIYHDIAQLTVPQIERTTIIKRIVAKKKLAVLPLIEKGLTHEDPLARAGAAEALARIGDKRGINPLIRMLRYDPNYDVRRKIVMCLAGFGNEKVVEKLMEPDIEIPETVAMELAKTPEAHRKIADALRTVLSPIDYFIEKGLLHPRESNQALHELIKLTGTGMANVVKDPAKTRDTNTLLRARYHKWRKWWSSNKNTFKWFSLEPNEQATANQKLDDLNFRLAAAKMAGFMKISGACTLFQPFLEHDNKATKLRILPIIGRIGSDEAVDLIIGKTTERGDPAIRKAALETLGLLKEREVVDRFSRLLDAADPKQKAKGVLAAYLKKMNNALASTDRRKAIMLVIEALHDNTKGASFVQASARDAFASLRDGKTAKIKNFLMKNLDAEGLDTNDEGTAAVIENALKWAGRFGFFEERTKLYVFLEHENKSIRWQAIKTLTLLQDRAALTHMIDSCLSSEWLVRDAALAAIKKLGFHQSISLVDHRDAQKPVLHKKISEIVAGDLPLVAAFLNDERQDINLKIALLLKLADFAPAEAYPLLLTAFETTFKNSETLKKFACFMVQRISAQASARGIPRDAWGAQYKKLASNLITFAKGEDAELADVAIRALSNIGTKTVAKELTVLLQEFGYRTEIATELLALTRAAHKKSAFSKLLKNNVKRIRQRRRLRELALVLNNQKERLNILKKLSAKPDDMDKFIKQALEWELPLASLLIAIGDRPAEARASIHDVLSQKKFAKISKEKKEAFTVAVAQLGAPIDKAHKLLAFARRLDKKSDLTKLLENIAAEPDKHKDFLNEVLRRRESLTTLLERLAAKSNKKEELLALVAVLYKEKERLEILEKIAENPAELAALIDTTKDETIDLPGFLRKISASPERAREIAAQELAGRDMQEHIYKTLAVLSNLKISVAETLAAIGYRPSISRIRKGEYGIIDALEYEIILFEAAENRVDSLLKKGADESDIQIARSEKLKYAKVIGAYFRALNKIAGQSIALPRDTREGFREALDLWKQWWVEKKTVIIAEDRVK